jgi:hypothetical protein
MSSDSSAAARKVFFSVTDPTVWPRVMSPSVSVTATNSWRISSETRRSSFDSVGWSVRRVILDFSRQLLALSFRRGITMETLWQRERRRVVRSPLRRSITSSAWPVRPSVA